MRNRFPEWIADDSELRQRNTSVLQTFFKSSEGAAIADLAADYLGADAFGQVGSGFNRPNTELAYGCDQRPYIAAAIAAGVEPLAPNIAFWTAYFTAYAASHSVASLYRHSYGIANLFFRYNLPSPTRTHTHSRLLRHLAKGIKRKTRRAKALYGADGIKLLDTFGSRSLCDRRDKTICVIGLTRGFRSATITGLALEDITFEERGAILSLRHEKTSRNEDPIVTATPHSKGHKHCMVCTMKRFVDDLASLGVREGPLFRQVDRWGNLHARALVPKSVTAFLRRGLTRAGIGSPHLYASHSFRHGVVSAARRKGWSRKKLC